MACSSISTCNNRVGNGMLFQIGCTTFEDLGSRILLKSDAAEDRGRADNATIGGKAVPAVSRLRMLSALPFAKNQLCRLIAQVCRQARDRIGRS